MEKEDNKGNNTNKWKDKKNVLGDSFTKDVFSRVNSSALGKRKSLEEKVEENKDEGEGEFFVVVYGDCIEHWLEDPTRFVREARRWMCDSGFYGAVLELRTKLIDSLGEPDFDYLVRCTDYERIIYFKEKDISQELCRTWCAYSVLQGIHVLSTGISKKNFRLVTHSASLFDRHVDLARAAGLNSEETITNLNARYDAILNYALDRICVSIPFSSRNRISERELDIRSFIDRYGGSDYKAN